MGGEGVDEGEGGEGGEGVEIIRFNFSPLTFDMQTFNLCPIP